MSNLNHCHQCGTGLPQGARFCPNCGAAQKTSLTENTLPRNPMNEPLPDSAGGETIPAVRKKMPPPPPPPEPTAAEVPPPRTDPIPPPTIPDTKSDEFPSTKPSPPAYSTPSVLRRGIALLLDSLLVLAPLVSLYFIEPVRIVLMEVYYQYIDFGDVMILEPQTYYATAALVSLVLLWGVLYTLTRDGGGRSVGKRLAGLTIIHLASHRPISRGRAIMRNVLWIIPVMNLVILVLDILLVMSRTDRRRVGDLVADTRVILTREAAQQR